MKRNAYFCCLVICALMNAAALVAANVNKEGLRREIPLMKRLLGVDVVVALRKDTSAVDRVVFELNSPEVRDVVLHAGKLESEVRNWPRFAISGWNLVIERDAESSAFNNNV